jgi:fibronectin type III domain protein
VLERALELGKVNLSEDDPDVLVTACQLGTVLQKADDPAAARRVLEEAYAAGLWRLGESHSLMVEISHDIGVVAEELGNRHEARKAFTRVAEFGPAALGAGHWAVARARAYLGQDQNPRADVRGEAATPTQPAPPLPSMPSDSTWQPRFTSPGPAPVPPDEPTTSFEPAPTPESRQLWTGPPETITPAPPSPVEETTALHPAITPRPAPQTPAPQTPAPQPSTPQLPVPQQPVLQPPVQQTPQHFELEPAIIRPDSGQPLWGQSAPPAYTMEASPSYQKRGMGIFAAIAAVLAAVIAVAALVFVLANRSSDPADNSDVPTLGGSPPTAVKIVDNGSSIKINWQDPTEGTVSFLVAMGHPGEQLKPVTTLGPGQTSYEVSALNPSLNYCFAVVAVYRNNQFATSQQACTDRPATSATK